jgi:hypothetical protein
VSQNLAYEAKASEAAWLALDLLILLGAGGVITGEVKVAKGSTRSGHHLLELLLLVVHEAVLLLIIALVVVIPLGGHTCWRRSRASSSWGSQRQSGWGHRT